MMNKGVQKGETPLQGVQRVSPWAVPKPKSPLLMHRQAIAYNSKLWVQGTPCFSTLLRGKGQNAA